MKKIVTFTSGPPPVQQPTHWFNKDFGYIMWKTGYHWNRLQIDGEVVDHDSISVTPIIKPDLFEPRYGPLTITINFDEEKE